MANWWFHSRRNHFFSQCSNQTPNSQTFIRSQLLFPKMVSLSPNIPVKFSPSSTRKLPIENVVVKSKTAHGSTAVAAFRFWARSASTLQHFPAAFTTSTRSSKASWQTTVSVSGIKTSCVQQDVPPVAWLKALPSGVSSARARARPRKEEMRYFLGGLEMDMA